MKGARFILEAKATTGKSVAVSRKVWNKILQEAQGHHRYPLYVLGFISEERKEVEETLCVTTLDYIEHVLNPGSFVQEQVIEQVSQVLGSMGIERDIIEAVEKKILQLWEKERIIL